MISELVNISKLISGDSTAFRDLFNLLYPRMLAYSGLYVKDHSLAEDLVQDCFIQLWVRRKTLVPGRSVNSLMFVMLRNRCLNYLRDHKLQHLTIGLNEIEINDIQYLYHLDLKGEEEKSLEEQLMFSMQEAIDNLPPRQMEVFNLTKIEGCSHKEVAQKLGITVKAIEKNVAAANTNIRNELLRKFPTISAFIIFFFLP